MIITSDFFCKNHFCFNLTNEKISFSITIPGQWSSPGGSETIIELQKLLELRGQNDIKLLVEDIEKRSNQIKIIDNEHKITVFDTLRNEIIEKLKNVEYNDVEYMVFRLESTYTEILNRPNMKYLYASTTRCTLEPSIYEISDNNFMLKSLLPGEVKVNIAIDDIRVR